MIGVITIEIYDLCKLIQETSKALIWRNWYVMNKEARRPTKVESVPSGFVFEVLCCGRTRGWWGDHWSHLLGAAKKKVVALWGPIESFV